MEKRTLISIALAIALGLGAYATMRSPQKGEGRAKPPRPMPALKPADISKIDVTTAKGDHTTIEKRGDRWMITAPAEWAADPSALKPLLDGFEKLSFGDIVTEKPEKHAELGVGDHGMRLKVTASGTTYDFFLGETLAGFSMFRLAGKNEVWQAERLFLYTANKAPQDWRDRSIVDADIKDATRLTVEIPAGSRIELERDDKTWKVASSSGDAPKVGEPFDPSMATTVLSALGAMRATSFVEGKTPKEAGFEPPQLIITADGKSKKQVFEVGGSQADDAWVRKVGEPTIYSVKKYALDRVQYRPVDYRDKTLLHFKAEEVTALRVSQGKDETVLAQKDGAWKLPTGAIDQAKAKAVVAGIESLVGSSVVTDKAAKTGLDRPRATVRVDLKDGKKVTLKVGALTANQSDYYATLEGGKDIVLVKKFAVDRLLKKPADLAPGPPGGPHGMPPGGPHGMPPGMPPHGGMPPGAMPK